MIGCRDSKDGKPSVKVNYLGNMFETIGTRAFSALKEILAEDDFLFTTDMNTAQTKMLLNESTAVKHRDTHMTEYEVGGGCGWQDFVDREKMTQIDDEWFMELTDGEYRWVNKM